MNAAPPDEPRQARANVVQMPPRRTVSDDKERKAAPPGGESTETSEEPGYGHGV